MKNYKTIYFENEDDEVINFNIKKKDIPKNYKYINNNIIYKFFSFLIYRLIMTPIFWVYFKLFNRVKILNKKCLKNFKSGCFIYANHTNKIGDAVFPTFMCSPQKPHIIVNPDNVSLPFIGSIVKMCGALPLPSNIANTKSFSSAIKILNLKGHPIIVYPEAHLWPYYTKIRNFESNNFHYPVALNSPIFTATTTYHKRRFSKKPRIEIYIDGPFYPDLALNKQEQKQKLCETAFNQMCKRASLNSYEYVKYIKKENK